MRPHALFDKSFLQALSIDEATLFDSFFLPVISPIFYVETLADLAKEDGITKPPEQIVGLLALKCPEMQGYPCAFHGDIGINSLMGDDPPMNGQIPVAHGRIVSANGKIGAVFDKSPELSAFERWQEGEFLLLERDFAKQWRQALLGLDLHALAASAKRFGVDPKDAKTLKDVRSLAESVLDRLSPAEQLKLAMDVFGVKGQMTMRVQARWVMRGHPPLKYFARYARFVTLVEVFFALALASGKISPERSSNRCDISYLAYLPFCHLFVSSDRLHREVASLFMRSDQEFVWGPDLKADLKAQNMLLLQLPEVEREKGLISLGPHPSVGLVHDLWMRHIPAELEVEDRPAKLSEEGEKALMSQIQSQVDEATATSMLHSSDSLDSMTIKRRVSGKRGSWYQIPKDLPLPGDER